MIQPKINFLLIAFFWLFAAAGFSQEKQPLKNVLAVIEKQHQVKFNFTDETIANYTVSLPSKELSLKEKLLNIQDETALQFEIVNNEYIIITQKSGLGNLATAPAYNMAFDLNEVSIDNYLTSGISKKKYGNFVIKPQQFGILPGLIEPDVLQTMQQIPGISSVDETISNINVRGGTHDQNLFLWNGIRMFQTGHFFGLISAFNPTLAQSISILKNGSPAFFGESVSSVVDISTHTKAIENSSSSVGLNLISGDFFTKIKLSETASFVLSGRRSYTDIIDTPTYRNYYNRIFQNTIVTKVNNNQVVGFDTDQDFYFYDFTLQYRQKIGKKHEFFVDGIGISNELGVTQSTVTNDVFNVKSSLLEQENFGGNIAWKAIWNPKNRTQASVYISSYKLDATESFRSNQVLRQQNKILDLGFRLENNHQLTNTLSFNNGYQFNEIGITNFDDISLPALQRNIGEVMRSHALILETEYSSENKKLLLKGGVRTNYFEQLKEFVVEPRLQFNYTLTRNIKIEILGEQKSQTTSQIIDLQRDFLGVEKRRWTLASETVPLQKSKQVSVGFSFKNKSWQLTLDNFYKTVSGISSPGQAFQNQLELIRVNGKYTVLGSEFLIQRNFKNFYTWLGYSFNHNEYQFNYFIPSRFPNNFEIRHSVSAAAIYEHHRLKIALGSKYNSGRPTTAPIAISNTLILYDIPNEMRVGDYIQFNVSASYSWNLSEKTKLHVSASVLNIFDQRNIINKYYRVNTIANDIESVNTYSIARTPNLSMRLTF